MIIEDWCTKRSCW